MYNKLSEDFVRNWHQVEEEMKPVLPVQLCDCCKEKVDPFQAASGEFQFHNGTSNINKALCEDCAWAVHELLFKRRSELSSEFCKAAYTGSNMFGHKVGCNCKSVRGTKNGR